MAAVIDFEQLLHEGLVATENVECSTIIKKKDCSIKAKSTGYQPTQDQIEALLEGFVDKKFYRNQTISFNGATYTCVRADKHSIYAKKGDSGFICVNTESMLVFGTYSSTMFASVCVEAVEKIGEYLIKKGL